MDTITQVVALGMVGTLCAAALKRQVPDMALVLTLCAVAMILTAAMGAFRPVRELMDLLAQRAGLSAAVLGPVVRTVGVALLTRVCAELCRDAGERGVASAVEAAGSACALVICLPLLEAVAQLILELL